MKIVQKYWTDERGWSPLSSDVNLSDAQLVLVFASTSLMADPKHYTGIKKDYPNAIIMGCSTAGEICGTKVRDDSISLTAVKFDHTRVQLATQHIQGTDQSFDCGKSLATNLIANDLKHILVISDGLKVNGTDLVKGMRDVVPENVAITGGLSGDGARFEHTFVCCNNGPEEGAITAIGFYGTHLNVSYGSMGGWETFGPERLITKSAGNKLYELDGVSALELYKTYLGEHAKGLPSTGLLFPLSLRSPDRFDDSIVRTILSVDEDEQSITFAGDIPQGYKARLMKANIERLIDGATNAAHITKSHLGTDPQMAILISCVGRKLVLKQRIEEEVEGVRVVLGEQAVLAGFYSYGEISPHTPTSKSELHNQTMTITTFSEI